MIANDLDGDDQPVVISHTAPQFGTLAINANGTFQYSPGPNFPGEDTFTYTISDGLSESTATVRLTGWPADAPPPGRNTLIPVSTAQPVPRFGQNADLVDNVRGLVLASQVVAGQIAEFNAGRLREAVYGILAERRVEITEDFAVWTDAQREVHGSALFGRKLEAGQVPMWDEKDVPFGTVNFNAGTFTGTVYFPITDAEGKITELKELIVKKDGLFGELPLSDGSFIKFDKGFSEAQITHNKLRFTFDRPTKTFKTLFDMGGNNFQPFVIVNNQGVNILARDFRLSLDADDFTLTAPKIGTISLDLVNKTVDKLEAMLDFRRGRSLTLSYTNGLLDKQLSATLHTPRVNLGLTWTPNEWKFSGYFTPVHTPTSFLYAVADLSLNLSNGRWYYNIRFGAQW